MSESSLINIKNTARDEGSYNNSSSIQKPRTMKTKVRDYVNLDRKKNDNGEKWQQQKRQKKKERKKCKKKSEKMRKDKKRKTTNTDATTNFEKITDIASSSPSSLLSEPKIKKVKLIHNTEHDIQVKPVNCFPSIHSCPTTPPAPTASTIQWRNQQHEQTQQQPQQQQQQQQQKHTFRVDNEADHCETPLRAYQDIIPILDQIALQCGKSRHHLIIYDPYYCDGGSKKKLYKLGFSNVINNNRDFYSDIINKTIPKHDVILTNPPYSGDHMESLLKFVSNNYKNSLAEEKQNSIKKKEEKQKNKQQQQRNQKFTSSPSLIPFLLLLPHYVYTKPYFQTYFRSDARGGGGAGKESLAYCSNDKKEEIVSSLSLPHHQKHQQQQQQKRRELFYLVPKNNYRYSYEPPSWVSHKGKAQTSPFPSFWYCHVPSLQKTQQKQEPLPRPSVPFISSSHQHQQEKGKENVTTAWLIQTFGMSGTYHVASSSSTSSSSSSRLHYVSCTAHLPREFKGEFDITNKRPNPRARKRAAKKQQQQQQQQQQKQLGYIQEQQQQQQQQQSLKGIDRVGKRKKKRY